MNKQLLTFCLLALIGTGNIIAQRIDRLINDNWNFRFSHQVETNVFRRVDLPHTWNAQDALSGKPDYKRGIGNYTKKIHIDSTNQGKRTFLRFEGANNVCNLFVNGQHIGEHRGGYGAFIFEVTDALRYGVDNELLVRVNNAEQLDIMPLVGDFNFYGGLYRNVHLLTTAPLCISPLDYASSGIYLVQKKVTEQQAELCAKVLLSNASDTPRKATLGIQIFAGEKSVLSQEKLVEVPARADDALQIFDVQISNPHLWNATADPFMYRAVVTLHADGKEIDRVEQPLGLRYYHTDANNGFFLNGRHLPLYGVCRHQDRAEVGNALQNWHHEEDVQLMLEMGVNAVRLAHYPQAEYMYDLMDKHGIVTWAEIPFVGPGGYGDKGFVNQPSFLENGRQQLKEMIRQHFNHPSICFWGLFNELKATGDNPQKYIEELNALAHQEDPTRPTVAASNQNGAMNFVTDNIAWNRYDGWYGSTPSTLAKFLDATHREHPQIKISISEYGAGGSIYHQQDTLVQSQPNSWWHPENWQTYYHVENWRILSARPFVWGTFVWNMFDFGAAHRTEGDRSGINNKGLVTFDRKVKKDAFYFYKANWNPTPMIHLAGKREVRRLRSCTDIQVFCNAAEVTLKLNGKIIRSVKPDNLRIALFKNVELKEGENLVEVTAKVGGRLLYDSMSFSYMRN